MLLSRSSRADAVNELYKPRNERNKGSLSYFPVRRRGRKEENRSIERNRFKRERREDSLAGLLLLFTVDNESGAV